MGVRPVKCGAMGSLHQHIFFNNNNNELYLHGRKRELQHCKSILTMTKSKSNENIKAFDNKLSRISKQDDTYCTSCLLVYVIAWARGQLRINFTSIFKVFT